MTRLTVLVALFLAGCAATNPAVSQSKSSSQQAMHAAAKTPACYKSTQSVNDDGFQNTVTDSDC
jgi:starvation-inducible outer membrane lipoprotein